MSDYIENYKEVYYREYCPRCKYAKRTEEMEPCCYCLEAPFVYASHKPEKFEEAD